MTWRTDGRICPGGDVGGDIQAGDSYSIRFHQDGDPCRLVTVYAYPVQQRSRIGVEIQTEFMVCQDPRDPGSSELWSDAMYVTDPHAFDSIAAADRYARRLIEGYPSSNIDWDGKAPWETR